MSTRRTCEFLECDLYTVHKYAVKLGILKPEDVTFLEKHKDTVPPKLSPSVLPANEERALHREQWTQLMYDNPNATRSLLITLNPASYLWLRKNDRDWYEQNSPESKHATSMDWTARDAEIFPQVQNAVIFIRTVDVRPRWLNKRALIKITGLNQLGNKSAMARLPKIAEYLAENLESIVDWRKRKIIWAIEMLRKDEAPISPNKIKIAASISPEAFQEFYEFTIKILEKED